jgi:hypothetical protein
MKLPKKVAIIDAGKIMMIAKVIGDEEEAELPWLPSV